MTEGLRGSGIRDARRGPRFDLAAAVRYRIGDGAWLDATTVNIGRFGLLMLTRAPALPLDTVMELRVFLTARGNGHGANVACSGRVVRTDPSPGSGEVLTAVTIVEYRFQPAGPVLEDATHSTVHEGRHLRLATSTSSARAGAKRR
jgi:hypothetical protein